MRIAKKWIERHYGNRIEHEYRFDIVEKNIESLHIFMSDAKERDSQILDIEGTIKESIGEIALKIRETSDHIMAMSEDLEAIENNVDELLFRDMSNDIK